MWERLCTGLLVLAMTASATTTTHAHLHTGNGHRVSHDRDHAGDPAQPLWHTHDAAHAHDAHAHLHEPAASSSDAAGHHEPLEDVVSVGALVASSPTPGHWTPPLLVAIIVARSTLDTPAEAWTVVAGVLPPIHAPPLIGPCSSRAPPTFAHPHV
jgi:hypothetical protein